MDEALSRSADASGALATRVLAEVRRPLNAFVTLFSGDVINYIGTRGTPEAPGEIPRRVLGKLAEARATPPHCAEVLGWAVRQNSELLERARLGKRRREALGELHQQLRLALRFFRSGWLFAVFAGPSRTFGPELVLPLEASTVRSSS